VSDEEFCELSAAELEDESKIRMKI